MTDKDNFIYLTWSLALLLFAVTIVQNSVDPAWQRLVQSATVLTLLLAVWGVQKRDKRRFVLPVLIIAFSVGGNLFDDNSENYFHLFLLLVFLVLTAFKTAKQVLFSGEVTGNTILGSICLYVLFGLIWAVLYTLLEILFGNAFTGIGDSTSWHQLLPDFIYFSFVTITTLGYGDISPIVPITRFFVYLEAIIGQFYIAILVASLVGSRLSSVQEPKSNKPEGQDDE
ncbi:two pore domain potassium channel family protein [Thalassotalea sp. HSM 43]|uniref:potassium channel family protein n=1 Tax=Thalassotalea sp. HSM 43 TaxID=2552945 RepID=UPI00107FDEAA|nr:potassium channel family protein [Thalassotalea sp. HSM 43]QBY04852.1 two pore domain potassium channel family protein [Thalassotalea sp. HSM 43]